MVLFAVALEIVPDQQRNVLFTLPKRRHLYGHDIQTIVEIQSEFLCLNEIIEVPVRRGEYPDVGVDVLKSADPSEFPFLDQAEDLRLHRIRHISDLVEEHRPALRHFNKPFLRGLCVGERALFVPEQLAFYEMFGNIRTSDLHERLPLPRT